MVSTLIHCGCGHVTYSSFYVVSGDPDHPNASEAAGLAAGLTVPRW